MRTVLAVSVLVAIAFSSPLAAEGYRNDLSVSLGGATFPDITETAKEIGGLIGTIGLLHVESKRATPAVVFS